jgi:DNA-binding NarL/FixJ family response regulator
MKQRVRVLIADDQQPTRQGLVALLALLPRVEVVGEAQDGQEAVHLVAERQPDVVVMDLQMPVMDGLEATQYIKSRWPEVKIIALTLYAGYRTRALAAGADTFLLKGSPTEVLKHAILSHRGRSRD